MVRVEVQVAKTDATLIRAVASALADPSNAPQMRALLRERLGQSPKGLKALLESAPLEGIPIARTRERSRRIAL
jgi:hypothetical protein